MSSKKWFVIGISGVTCGGKTSLAERIHKELNDSVLISQDDYCISLDDQRQVKIPELNHWNFELITSMDMEKMYSDILKVIEPSTENQYTEPNRKRVLILDGFLLFECEFITKLCDQKYFLTLTEEQCGERRKDRTYEPPDPPGYFEKVVWPEYMKHQAKVINDKDLCKTLTFIDGSQNKEEIFQMVFAEIKKLLS